MSLFHALTSKPWETSGKPLSRKAPARVAGRTGLILFLAVITMLFVLLATAFYGRMPLNDWQPLAEPSLLWVNTVLLAISSIALHWAWASAAKDRQTGIRYGLVIAMLSAVAFLAGQMAAWQQLADLGFYAATNPANAFFYLITGLHGLHLLGGLLVLALVIRPEREDQDRKQQMRLRLELCAAYWHFLLLVWFLIFAMLVSDNGGKFDLLAICRGLLTNF